MLAHSDSRRSEGGSRAHVPLRVRALFGWSKRPRESVPRPGGAGHRDGVSRVSPPAVPYIRAFQYDKVATLTVVVLVMVIASEQLSVWICRQLR
jgi:hypothetical protein